MTALVSSQPAFMLDSGPPSGGILLNARSISAPLNSLQRTYQSPSSALASSSSSVSQASDSHSRSRSSTFGDATARKIRFAPLPAPRRDDFPAVFDQDESESDSPGQLPRHSSVPADFSPAPPSPALSAHSLQDPEQQSDDLTYRDKGGKAKSKKWGQKLLRPLLQPLLPSSSSKGSEEALGPSPSREGSKFIGNGNGDVADELKDGAPLGRRMSANGITTSKEAERSQAFRDGGPLTHVLSEGGGGSSRGRKDGQRMLNGRVYGKRASSADRERAERKQRQVSLEPEFVEWGYGGMGSVSNDHARGRGNSSGPDWAKVQSRGRTFGDTENGDGEGDDGSGMGWVRRRREQREREKREKEEREKMQKEHASVPEIEVHPPESKVAEEKEHILAPMSEPDCEVRHKDEEHHVYRAISVPAPHHHHTRHHSYHKGGEIGGTVTPTSALSLSRTNSAGSVPPARRDDALLNPLQTEKENSSGSGSSVNSLASKTSSESLDEDDNEGTERESDDEDDDGEEESRITSKSAGVEKISRHKE